MSAADFTSQMAVRHFFQFIDAVSETVLGNTAHSDTVSLFCLKHGVALFEAGSHGFFHQYIFSGIHTMDGDPGMGGRRCADMYQVDVQA